MSKLFYLLVSALMLFCSQLLAQGIYIGYCDGVLGTSEALGMTGNNVTIQCAVHLTPAMIDAYTTGEITAVHAGLAEGSNYYPAEITGWVRADKDSEDLANGTIAASAGWNLIPLDSSVSLSDYGESGIWVGFSFVQSRKMNIIPLELRGDPIENTGWIAKGNNWTDFSESGVLSIEAVVEGNDVPMRNLSIVSAQAVPDIIKIGNDIHLDVKVKNNALEAAVNPIVRYMVGDCVSGEYVISQKLEYRDEAAVSIVIPTDEGIGEGDYCITLDLSWSDGEADEVKEDNLVEIPVSFASEVFYKKMLVEEGTGAWCGFCVRGIVGLRTMKEKYPDRFIGLSIHNRDQYVVASYDDWIWGQVSSYPCCLVNRDGSVYDPSAEFLEDYLLNRESWTSNVGISLQAIYTNGTIRFDSEIRFIHPMNAVSYNVVYVIVEDKLPIIQSNYYTNNAIGEMGGFENLPAHADIIIDDVVRGIFPDPAGYEAVIGNVVNGEVYTHSITQSMPEFSNGNNVYAVAFVVDNVTGKILNATKVESIQGLGSSAGIEQIQEKKEETGVYYNLSGAVLSQPRGLLIRHGKAVFVK